MFWTYISTSITLKHLVKRQICVPNGERKEWRRLADLILDVSKLRIRLRQYHVKLLSIWKCIQLSAQWYRECSVGIIPGFVKLWTICRHWNCASEYCGSKLKYQDIGIKKWPVLKTSSFLTLWWLRFSCWYFLVLEYIRKTLKSTRKIQTFRQVGGKPFK